MSIKLNGKHEKDKRSCRDGMVDGLLECMEKDPTITYIDCDLMGCVNTKKLQKAHPERVFNAGIAEQNAIGVAAGLAATGKKSWVHSFGCFASRRMYDQAYLAAGYSGLDVKVLGSDAGVTAKFNGATHMPLEDAGMYMSIPKSIVTDPCDYVQLKSIVKGLNDKPGLSYTRFIRKDHINVYGDDSEFEIGKGVVLHEGTDATIICSGIMVDESLKAWEKLTEEGISVKVIDMFTWKPLDEELILKSAKETGAIVTAENHNVVNGLGSAVANLIIKNDLIPMEMVGVQDKFGEVGPQDYLMKQYNLTADDIIAAVKKAIARK